MTPKTSHHEAPDVAELLRRLAENATPGPWTFEAPQRFEVPIEREFCRCSGVGDEYEFVSETADGHVHLWHESHIIYAGENVVAGNYDCEDGGILERRDRDYIAAANPATVLGLLDRLAHMTEARDNARAEVERLTANPRDEYHTMDELYEYRMLYNALAANAMPDRAVKSWRHSGGKLCFGGGWFVVYLNLPTGQVSNHYKAEHWELFRIPEAPSAPEYDGHTPAIAADRLRATLGADSVLDLRASLDRGDRTGRGGQPA